MVDAVIAQPFAPTWESLQHYQTPEWFKDAKLGIFIHWGVYAVPAFENEWYPRNMYQRGTAAFAHHRRVWGDQSRFGYKDFIPLFKAEQWDPTAWVTLFQQAGARYVVPVGEHHDGFAMYGSEYTRWNALNMGPRRDIVAELAADVRAAGLKFGVSSHRAFNWRYYTYENTFDTTRPDYADLYGLPHPADTPYSIEFLDNWYGRTTEIINKFRPDLLWFDFGWHAPDFDRFRPQIAAYYYNQAHDWGREVVLNYKDKFPPGTAVLNIERGKLSDIHDENWQTDTSTSYKSWGYVAEDEFKSPTSIIHDLIDIVSKNGNLLLNVGPRADGTIPDEAQALLRAMGDWLRINGEAIYATRPWGRFGEGPTAVAAGHMTERQNAPFTAQDIRFTTKPDTLFAILLGWPAGAVAIRSLGHYSVVPAERISAIHLLGVPQPLEWTQDNEGLHIQLPAEAPCEHAYVFKIALKPG
jgi:alpha-L-fucosidase